MLFISNHHQTHGHVLEMAFPVLQAVSCLSPPILGANERLMHKGVFIALIAQIRASSELCFSSIIGVRFETVSALRLSSRHHTAFYGNHPRSGPTVVR
jgi:hypothetical protein